jgi:uncharacterized membrane protein
MTVLKTIHVICGVLWLGNFAITGIWSARAFLARDAALERFAVREILFTDAVFTLIGGAAVVMSGLFLAGMEQIAAWSTAWTRDALIVAVGSAIIWLAVLLPLEFRMRRLAAAGPRELLVRDFIAWSIVGWLITVALFGVIYLMVAKPV